MKRAIYYAALLSIIFSACCDDDGNPMPPINPCTKGLEEFTELVTEIEDSNFVFCPDTCFIDCEELYSSAIPFDYTEPCFNPKNPEQLAYYRFGNTAFEVGSEIWVVDFCTGEKKMIVNNALYGLDWSVKDWLIYTADDQNIWKIKSNGDSLTQLTFVGDYNRYPKWSPDGDKIAFNAEIGGQNFFFLSKNTGEIIDTIQDLAASGAWSWVDENRICYLITVPNSSPTITNMQLFNLGTKEIKYLHGLTIANNNDSLVISTAPLLTENSMVWCALGFIGKTNLETGSFTILKKTLRQEKFLNLSVRPNETEILINKRVMHNAPFCRVDSEVDFYLINKDGSNTRRITLPH